MITKRPSAERGHFDHGWLDTYHTFSFADYHDDAWMGFGDLRVINQDVIAAAQGFGTHGHRDMEIITYVLRGVLAHEDSMGNGSQIKPGDVQFMSAGTGVTHSEFNGSKEEACELLQMWVVPAQRGTKPRYAQKQFPVPQRRGRLCLVASQDGRDGSIQVGQDVALYAALLAKKERAELALAPGRRAWVHVARGSVAVNGTTLAPGDGAAVEGEKAIVLEGKDDAELVLFDLA